MRLNRTLQSISGKINVSKNLVGDTRGAKAASNETPALAISKNMDIWVAGTSNQLFTTRCQTETKFSEK